jgi:uncharacterized protein
MGKLLVLVLLVVIAVWLIKRAISRRDVEIKETPAHEDSLVACARCGVNLPRAEARGAGSDLYCSEEHARLGKP